MIEGRLKIEIVTAKRDGQRMMALPAESVPAWFEALLQGHGIEACRIGEVRRDIVRGRKTDRHTGTPLEIQLPVSEIHFDAVIVHRAKANLAWAYGVGRGKRFGFGMLRVA